jgi:nucleoside-diphosphate-sugar epimerase
VKVVVTGASGKAGRAVIDRSYPLEQVVDGTRDVETQQKTGNVVLAVNGERGT